MKKAIGYIALGYALSELHDAWRRGYFSRAFEFGKARAQAGDDFSFQECYEYVAQEPWPGKKVTEERATRAEVKTKEHLDRLSRSQAMKIEGYSNAEIAEALGLSENSVRIILEPEEEKP